MSIVSEYCTQNVATQQLYVVRNSKLRLHAFEDIPLDRVSIFILPCFHFVYSLFKHGFYFHTALLSFCSQLIQARLLFSYCPAFILFAAYSSTSCVRSFHGYSPVYLSHNINHCLSPIFNLLLLSGAPCICLILHGLHSMFFFTVLCHLLFQTFKLPDLFLFPTRCFTCLLFF